ncbi:MAG TPA: FkbM family methyltransferase [Solirubrobacteraceae bacterium]|nr:FkbM family methyltransferase [Solirubrobacteraceae bacterium]
MLRSEQPYRGLDGLTLAIDRDDPFQASMLLGLYDPVVKAIIERYTPAGGIVIDGGAFIGYIALLFARRVGPTGSVHSFECDPRVLPRLRRNVEINGMDWVIVNPRGLFDRTTAEAQLALPSQLGWASMQPGAWGATEATTVAMVALDDYVAERGIDAERISFIKLDLEGCELEALQGARGTLAAASAPVLVELIPDRMRALGQDPEELLALMNGLGYEPWAPLRLRRGAVRFAPGIEPQVGEDVLFLKRAA